MANSVGPDQTAPIGAVCSGSTLFASIPYSSVMLGNYLQQTTSADNFFQIAFFLGPLRVKFLVCKIQFNCSHQDLNLFSEKLGLRKLEMRSLLKSFFLLILL